MNPRPEVVPFRPLQQTGINFFPDHHPKHSPQHCDPRSYHQITLQCALLDDQ